MSIQNNQKSINWINAVKAIAIIGVFFVHSQLHYGCVLLFDKWIYPWYVNAFFFVSGYLLFWKQLTPPKIDENRKVYISTGGGRILIFNILYRIIIPSIIFSIIEFVPSCLIQGRDINVGFALYKTIGGGTYWFTSALVVAELILLLLFLTRRKSIWFYTCICLFIGTLSYVLLRLGVLKSGVWSYRQGLISLIFLTLGGLYWRYEKQVDRLMKWWFAVPLFVVYVAIIFWCKNTNPLISTLEILPLGFVTSIMACLLLVWLCKCLPEMKTLTFIGQNSIGFYFLSGALPIPLGILAQKAIPGISVWVMLAIFIICLIAAYLAVMIINRWLPWLWDLRQLKK